MTQYRLWKPKQERLSARIPKEFFTEAWYGLNVYTSYRAPLPATVLTMHLARLLDDAGKLGLSTEGITETLFAALQKRHCPPPQAGQPAKRVRLTLMPFMADLKRLLDPAAFAGDETRLLVSEKKLTTPLHMPLQHLTAVNYQRTMPHIKHGSLADTLMLRRLYHRPDCSALEQDLLWVNGDGHISEASFANIYGVTEAGLWTPDPEAVGCLPGITRLKIMQAAHLLNIPVQTQPKTLKECQELAGLFTCNSVAGLRKVKFLDDEAIGWPLYAKELLAKLIAGLFY